MAQEQIVFSTSEGKTKPGTAEIIRYSPAGRITMASLYGVGGFFAATVCIVVPIAHLVTTWAFPLLGIVMAMRTYNRKLTIYEPKGICPACGEAIELAGGSLENLEWQVCPKCRTQLRVTIESEPPVAASE